MTNPITVKHRTDDAEAMEFTGSHDSAWDLAKWLQESTKGTYAGNRLAMNYASGLGEVPEFNFYLGDDGYEMHPGDWLVRDGNLFSMVRRADFPLRYVSAIEKIKLEAGMV